MTKKVKLLKFAGSILVRLIFFVMFVLISITVGYPAILRFIHRLDAAGGIDLMEAVEIGGIYQVVPVHSSISRVKFILSNFWIKPSFF